MYTFAVIKLLIMAKGKSTWKYNKLLTPRRNYFFPGGTIDIDTGMASNYGAAGIRSRIMGAAAPPPIVDGMGGAANPTQGYSSQTGVKGTTPDASSGGGFNAGKAMGIASLASQATSDIINMVGAIQGNDVKEKAEGMINDIHASQMQEAPVHDTYDAIINDWRNLKTTKNITAEQLGKKGAAGVIGSSFMSAAQGAMAGSSLGPWGMLGGAIGGQVTSLIGSIARNRNANKWEKRVNQEVAYTNDFNNRSMIDRLDRVASNTFDNLEANYGAFGGELNTQGGDFTNGLLYIDNGGSHESNPFEGVPMGIDPEGVPNLVEEGETIFNDYVFSKRLKVPKAIRNKYKLGGKFISFADASKKLAKESEERPNDPISQNGLNAFMSDLANAQEELKARKEGNKFANGGTVNTEDTWWYDNKSSNKGSFFEQYLKDEELDFSAMYADNSEYRKRLDNIARILYKSKMDPNYQYTPEEMQVLKNYAESINARNDRRKYTDVGQLTYDKIIGNALKTTDNGKTFSYTGKKDGYALDKKRGGHHWGVVGESPAAPAVANIREEHMLRGANGLSAMPQSDIYYSNVNKDTGKTWDETFKDKYKRVNNGNYTEFTDDKGDTVRRYFYDPVEAAKQAVNRYYYRGKDGQYILYEGDDAPLYMRNNGMFATSDSDNNLGGRDYFYDPNEEVKQGKYADWLRYAPAVGFGIGALTDALGITNKPDYSNADAILEATRNAGKYQPVSYKPIGNYLTYRPIDRDYYINKMSAEAGATRRAITANAGMNRGQAIAGLLAADNNYLGQIGDLGFKAEDINFNRRAQVEEFNRATNMTNSEGFLKADLANQSALASLRDFNMKGNLAAAEMRERERLATDANKSANISGLFQTLGDIGFEEKNAKMRDWAIKKGIFGPGTEDYGRVKIGAKGGKIKRKRGLTL